MKLFFNTNASIIRLLASCRPTDIARFIVAVIVRKSIKRMVRRRTFPYICKEIFKFVPAFTNLDSTTAIMTKGFLVRISATIQHCLPVLIFGNSGKAVRQISVSGLIAAKTTAANYFSLAHCLAFNYFFSTATTATKPKCAVVTNLLKGYYKKTAKCLTSHIDAMLRRIVATPTSATFLLSAKEITATDDARIATIATAFPSRTSLIFDEFNYRQTSKFLSGHINRHGGNIFA